MIDCCIVLYCIALAFLPFKHTHPPSPSACILIRHTSKARKRKNVRILRPQSVQRESEEEIEEIEELEITDIRVQTR